MGSAAKGSSRIFQAVFRRNFLIVIGL